MQMHRRYVALAWLWLLVGCHPGQMKDVAGHGAGPHPGVTRQVQYQCGDMPVRADLYGDRRVLLVTPVADHLLTSVVSGSEGSGEEAGFRGDGQDFRMQGDQAQWLMGNAEPVSCRVVKSTSPWARAGDQGLLFRGVGHEPGWLVEVVSDGTGMRLLLDNGARELWVEGLSPIGHGEGYLIEAEEEDIRLYLRQEDCQDSMSGWRFPVSARLELAGQHYTGCGRYYSEAS